MLGLYYDRTAPGVNNNGLVQIFFHARNPERSLTVIPPLLYARRAQADGNSDWTWCTLYYRTHEGDKRTTTLFPFYWYSGTKVKSHQVVFPFYWHFTNEETHTRFTMIGPLMSPPPGTGGRAAYCPSPGTRATATRATKSNGLVSRLFYQSSGRDKFSLLTVPAGYRRNGPSRFWYLFPLIFHHSDEVMDANPRSSPRCCSTRAGPRRGADHLPLALLAPARHRRVDHDGVAALLRPARVPRFADNRAVSAVRALPADVRTRTASCWRRSSTGTRPRPTPPPSSSRSTGTSNAAPIGPDRASRSTPAWKRNSTSQRDLRLPDLLPPGGARTDGTLDGTYRRFVVPFYDSGVKRPGDFMWEILAAWSATSASATTATCAFST